MSGFRLGLVGAGRMGQTHLRALANSDLIQVRAIAEPSEAIRATLGDQNPKLHADLDGMLAAGGLDGILIAVPSALHLQTLSAVAQAGLPILCEKPCGLSAAEGRQAAALAESAGVALQIAYWRRFVPALRDLRQRIADGQFGSLYHAACFQWDETPPSAQFRATGGGAFMDMGVHEFDQLRWLTGQEIGRISIAVSSSVFDVPVPQDPDALQALCTLSGGATGLVSLGRRFPAGDACWVQMFGTQGFEDCRFYWPPDGTDIFMAALRAQAEGFAEMVSGNASQGATIFDAISAIEAAERASKLLEMTDEQGHLKG
jgi:myo-inositol 2-dehydrogenase / D-chiro-inositol 1-dehydrogenase